jgi:hypothetical protein
VFQNRDFVPLLLCFFSLSACNQKNGISSSLDGGNGSLGSSASGGATPIPAPNPTPGPNPTPTGNTIALNFSINVQASRTPISPYIYGMNAPDYSRNVKLMRLGGNRWTAYNWTTNASNAGSDWLYENDNNLTQSSTPGIAVTNAVSTAQSNGVASIVTVPIVDYVAGDENGPVSSSQYAPTSSNVSTPRFASNILTKGSAFTLNPSPATGNGGKVYADEFVNFIESKYPNAHNTPSQDVFYMLDNEPGLWDSTHPEVHSAQTTYAEMATRTVNASKAIKAVASKALIFGGVCWGFTEYDSLQNAPDANQNSPFQHDYLSFLLNTWSKASATAGKRLVDVLDLHWYDQASNPIQDTRSLWDPSYNEHSWVTNEYQSITGNAAIQLIPWVMGKIAVQNPGTKLSFSEYNFGGAADITGGIAEADLLGIFGRYGVFAAAEWPMASSELYIMAAFNMFQKYDGTHTVGDVSVAATTPDVTNSSVYAMASSSDPSTVYVVLINKNSTTAINGTLSLTDNVIHSQGTAYILRQGNAASVAGGTVTSLGNNTFSYQMPPYSVSTLVLH